MPAAGWLWPSGDDCDGGDIYYDHDDDNTLGERGREMLDKETKNGSKIKETGLQAVLKRRV